jgi:hypothetical protein
MRNKALTIDCVNCRLCEVDNNTNFVCSWGQTPKIMYAAKGKKALRCKLKR